MTVPAPRQTAARSPVALGFGLCLFAALLFVVCLASIGVGSRPVAPDTVIEALLVFDPANNDHQAVRGLRVPRTGLGILVGLCLGLAGAIMQGAIRNPIADPGLLGVNAGAAFAVVLAIAAFGITSLYGYVWFAFIGAAATATVVFVIASIGRDGPTPIKLALSGVVLSAFLGSVTTIALVTSQTTLDQFRFWQVGSLAGRDLDILLQTLPFAAIGTICGLLCGPVLNTLGLGDEIAAGLGQNVGRARLACAGIIVLLCGTATAAAGPIGFVGLVVPHMARAITGPDYRWTLPYTALIAPILVLSADITGRIATAHGEVEVGIVMAIIGAPCFMALVRWRRLVSL